jgi:ADP-glucose pyrophosphorylase
VLSGERIPLGVLVALVAMVVLMVGRHAGISRAIIDKNIVPEGVVVTE